MRLKRKTVVLLACLLLFILAGGAAALFFWLRPPIVLVSDEAFTRLYGIKRTQKQQLHSAFELRRWVKQVIIADTVGTDLAILAIDEAVSRPWCVVFPYRYEDAARRYHEQYPETPVVLLRGRGVVQGSSSGETGLFFEFSNDIMLDFYRIGLFAAILSREVPGKIPVFIHRADLERGKEAFLQGFNSIEAAAAADADEEVEKSELLFYTNHAQLTSGEPFPVAVISGTGMEFLDRNTGTPLIVFTWLDPPYVSSEALIVMDDSVWAQLSGAVKMLYEGRKYGEIPSKPLIFSAKIADNGILQQLRKAARKAPDADPGFRELQ